MNELVKRLRDDPRPHEWKNGLGPASMEAWHKTCLEAADEIDRLKEEITARDDSELDHYAQGKRDAESRLTAEIEQWKRWGIWMSEALHQYRVVNGKCHYCGADSDLDCFLECIMHVAESVRIETESLQTKDSDNG